LNLLSIINKTKNEQVNPSITTHVSGLKPSATLAINEHCNALIQEKRQLPK